MTSEEYAKYFYQRTKILEKENLSFKKEIATLEEQNEHLIEVNKTWSDRCERERQEIIALHSKFADDVEKEVAKRIKAKEGYFRGRETIYKKEIDALKKRVSELLLDIEAMRAS